MPTVDEVFDSYAEVLMNGATPEVMIYADPPGLEPGTYLLFKGQEPERIGESEDFDKIWPSFLGIRRPQ